MSDDTRSPRAIGEARARAALAWIRRWGWSSPSVIETLIRSHRRGICARLTRSGLIEAVDQVYTASLAPLPRKIIRLTKAGLDIAETICDAPCVYDDICRPKLQQIYHDIKVQEIVANLISGVDDIIYTGPEAMAKTKSGKIPDAVISLDGKKIAIELELTKKRADEFCFGLISICRSIMDKRYDGYYIVCGNKSIAKRYLSAIAPGRYIDVYERGANRHLKKANGQYEVPSVIHKLVHVKTLS